MGSATVKALAFAALLALAPAAAAGADDQPVQAEVAQVDRDHPADEEPSGDDGPAYQTLSTLGALALGVIGLLWVRRHTAQL